MFSIGIPFVYLDKYKDNDKYKEYYVNPKHSSFKKEVLNYRLLSIKHYQTEIIPKINQYLNTNKVKSIKGADYHDESRYGVKRGTRIGFSNLLSIIVYTDYSELSSDFTGTFRRRWMFEPLQQTKARNKTYWWLSKILQQTVQIYGDDNYWSDEPLVGPFYTGMSMVMSIPQFQISLYSPTSTTIHEEVAMRFSGSYGMIIQFENNRGNARYTNGFDCSWISRYWEEDER